MGNLRVETEALLRDNNFGPDDFSEAVIKNTGFDDWSVASESEEALAARKDFRDETTFTIDPNGTEELDDAIHIKEVTNGVVEIGIHVADAAHFIKANSLVDREAKKRGTGVYLINHAVNMLPPKLASEICSLSPGEERFTVSVVFKVNLENGNIVDDDVWIGKAMIKSAGKLTYDDVDAVIGGKEGMRLQGATAKDIHTLKVIVMAKRYFAHDSLTGNDRKSHKNSERLGTALALKMCHHSVSFTNLMMKMCRWNITSSTPHPLMKSLRSLATKPMRSLHRS